LLASIRTGTSPPLSLHPKLRHLHTSPLKTAPMSHPGSSYFRANISSVLSDQDQILFILSGDVDHNPSARRSDSLSVSMSKNVAPIYTAIRLRLSSAQIAILAPGMEVITRSYKDHQRTGTSRLSYPFRMFTQARGFDRGTFNQLFMDNFLDLGERLISKTKTRQSVQMDTFQLRASSEGV
jgi:hypothetical protein